MRFEPEFGRDRIFRLRILAPGEAPRQAISGALRGRPLFGESITQRFIDEQLEQGATIRSTRLTDSSTSTKVSHSM